MTLTTDFKKPNAIFFEPTDAEISEDLGGIPVISFRPESLPYYREDGKYTPDELEAREDFVSERIRRVWPGYEGGPIEESAASTFFPFAGTVEPDDEIKVFVLFRPSLRKSAENWMDAFTGLKGQTFAKTIPVDHLNYIMVQHEVGHFEQNSKGLGLNPYESEWYSDTYALAKYRDAGGDPQVIEDYIHMRALSGFLNTSEDYHLGPILHHQFVDPLSDQVINDDTIEEDCKMSVRTLRIHTFLTSQNPDIDQFEIYHNLNDLQNDRPPRVKLDPEVSERVADVWKEGEFGFADGEKALRSLQIVKKEAPLSSHAHFSAIQILDAAEKFCPHLLAKVDPHLDAKAAPAPVL